MSPELSDMLKILSIPMIPLVGWIVSVERRISSMVAMKETIDRVDTKLDRLVEQLLREKH